MHMQQSRENRFEQLLKLYSDIKALKRKQYKLPKVRHAIAMLVNYKTDDKKFNSYIGFILNQLQKQVNFFCLDAVLNPKFKPNVRALYFKFTRLLTYDLQLELPLEVRISEPKPKVQWMRSRSPEMAPIEIGRAHV